MALIYLGWTFYSRRADNQAIERRAVKERNDRQAAQDRALMKAYGSDRVKISDFYGVPATIRKGEKAKLCYSVVNADKVRIEPQVKEDVWPSFSRCVNVSPQKDTTYKLIAESDDGQTATASLTFKVQ
jgi:hypothetical protein